MQNLQDDNNLDRLSREAAAGFEADQEMHSWDKLRPALDAAMPEKKRKRRFFFILLLFLLVGGGITVSAILFNDKDDRAQTSGEKITSSKKIDQIKKNDQAPETAGKISTATADNKPATENQAPGSDLTQTPNRNSEKKEVTADPTEQELTEGNSKLTDNNKLTGNNKLTDNNRVSPNDKNLTTTETTTTPGNKKIDNKTRNISPRNNQSNLPGNRNIISSNDNRRQKEKPATKISGQQPDVTESDVTATDKKPGTRPETLQSKIQKDTTTYKSFTEKASTVDRPSVDKTDTATADKVDGNPADKIDSASSDKTASPLTTIKSDKPSPKQQKASPLKNRWEFGATFAPDVSTVKFRHTRPPGLTAGITIGYNISRRFSIQTGAMYTAKNYKSDGKDYHPPKGYWTDYVKLETVTGECDMWDIPINLRYNIRPAEKYNVFVSAGLSSYIMKNEDYEYFYYYNGNAVTRARSYYTDEKYWLSVLNFSVGYERQVSRNFSLQVEPFFKQPLKGVGFGTLKLNSTGIFFTVRYKPLLRQARAKP